MRIGVLDDNPALCHILATTLALAGHNVSAHTDPLAFLEAIHRNIGEIDCVIVDFRLPGERTGVEIIAQVRQRRPHLPALLISGDPLPRAALQTLSNVAFCRKPFHRSELLAALSQLQDTKTLLENRREEWR